MKEAKTMGKLERSWEMVKASWAVLRQDKELMLFSLLSLGCCGLLCLGFLRAMLPDLLAAGEAAEASSAAGRLDPQGYFVLFFFYLALYLIGTYFSTAVAACAVIRLRGGDPTIADGLRIATSRLPVILGWALFAASVGMVLRIVEDKSKWVGKLVVGLLGMAFSIASFLVIPILAVEGVGPLEAFRRSAAMVKKTWGEQLAGNIGLGLLTFVACLPAVVFLAPGIMTGSGAALVTGILVAAVYLLAVTLVANTLQTVYQSAVYLYASDGQVPEGFSRELMEGAVTGR